MQPLDPTQPLPEDDEFTTTTKSGPREIVVSFDARPNLPGSKYISKTGRGSNADRACRDAIKQLFKDPRMKGRRATTQFPITGTFNFIGYGQDDE